MYRDIELLVLNVAAASIELIVCTSFILDVVEQASCDVNDFAGRVKAK